jgi:hypothetical protein
MDSKLTREFPNPPRDPSLVPGSGNGRLNREETLSAYRRVLLVNLGEENPLRKEDRP